MSGSNGLVLYVTDTLTGSSRSQVYGLPTFRVTGAPLAPTVCSGLLPHRAICDLGLSRVVRKRDDVMTESNVAGRRNTDLVGFVSTAPRDGTLGYEYHVTLFLGPKMPIT
ncbi:hypothetical protein Bbelb_228210 [Branchiostoma belcheri]|nr:hypothetical protein Bbelb_228210 [Branchiostoma belcheri]